MEGEASTPPERDVGRVCGLPDAVTQRRVGGVGEGGVDGPATVEV